MPRENPALERLTRIAEGLRPASDGVWRWLPVGIGVGVVLLIALIYALAAGRGVERVTLTTGTEGGSYFALGQVIAEALGQADPPLEARVVQSGGAAENARRVALNPDTLGLVQSNTALSGEVKLIARLYPEVFHLLARGDAGIGDVPDLAGKRVAVMPAGSGSNIAFFDLLQHYQVPAAEVTIVPGALQDGLAALQAGEVDALFVIMALGNETIAESIRAADIQLLGLDQAQAMALFNPALTRVEVPKGVYSGDKPVPPETIDVLGVDALLVANRALPDDTAAAIVTTLFERRQQMVEGNRQAAFISQPTPQQRLTIGVHPGAESYFQRDKPPLLVEYAEPIGVAISLLVLVASGLWQARNWLSNARKNRADRYNLQIAALVDEAEQAATPEELEEVRRRLFAIFHDVIADLDNDRIEGTSLQSFSFAWDVAESTLTQRQLMIKGQSSPSAS
ncbi:TAXI family TRAP transporter solute-binding subunit [Dichotomicrobium thermohalophilum]|uniref:TRAP transporter TAXI family solute receptor n=1 Tax=Dichotomicrobium thermohalophilum TaxID=933063 RepID=A0A397Q9H1_9HYPH|nr:TAXI family TRAP transporter solute-binding subunit [Dichotomicrobium thermohalophilum]RIA56455.1 TRAP transporter TAXI family solute receptor [Dichotomicrobium thermohalophilum]